jgi:hypothetical protein
VDIDAPPGPSSAGSAKPYGLQRDPAPPPPLLGTLRNGGELTPSSRSLSNDILDADDALPPPPCDSKDIRDVAFAGVDDGSCVAGTASTPTGLRGVASGLAPREESPAIPWESCHAIIGAAEE